MLGNLNTVPTFTEIRRIIYLIDFPYILEIIYLNLNLQLLAFYMRDLFYLYQKIGGPRNANVQAIIIDHCKVMLLVYPLINSTGQDNCKSIETA